MMTMLTTRCFGYASNTFFRPGLTSDDDEPSHGDHDDVKAHDADERNVAMHQEANPEYEERKIFERSGGN